jgi:hypothetical protein
VFFDVVVEVALGREGLEAPCDATVVGPLACVNAHVRFQVALFVEGSLAVRFGANVLFLTQVRFKVHL